MIRSRIFALTCLAATLAFASTAAQSQARVLHGRMRLLCGE